MPGAPAPPSPSMNEFSSINIAPRTDVDADYGVGLKEDEDSCPPHLEISQGTRARATSGYAVRGS